MCVAYQWKKRGTRVPASSPFPVTVGRANITQADLLIPLLIFPESCNVWGTPQSFIPTYHTHQDIYGRKKDKKREVPTLQQSGMSD